MFCTRYGISQNTTATFTSYRSSITSVRNQISRPPQSAWSQQVQRLRQNVPTPPTPHPPRAHASKTHHIAPSRRLWGYEGLRLITFLACVIGINTPSVSLSIFPWPLQKAGESKDCVHLVSSHANDVGLTALHLEPLPRGPAVHDVAETFYLVDLASSKLAAELKEAGKAVVYQVCFLRVRQYTIALLTEDCRVLCCARN